MARRFATCGAFVLASILGFEGEAFARSQPAILEPQQASQFVTIGDVSLEGNRVSGEIINRRSNPIRNVRLVIGLVYRWPNEYRPGQKSPNQAETLEVPGEIPAGGRKTFSTTFDRPMPPTSGGDFTTEAYIVSFTEILPPQLPAVASPGSNP